MSPHRLTTVLLVAIAAGALVFRLVRLDQRPMHNDEANQAYRSGMLQETGAYVYDPVEHHGPTLYYLTLPVAWATAGSRFAETSEWTYRLLPALFGAGVILLALLVRDGLGRVPILAGALIAAVSPAMVFYSRFYVQEMLLVFFTFGVIGCAWRYTRTRHVGWIVATGVFLGLTHATKETCVIAWAGMAGALVLLALVKREAAIRYVAGLSYKHLLLGAATALGVSVVLFSSFFTHWRGPVDSVMTYAVYLGRAGTDPDHIHRSPFWYLHMLTWIKYGSGPVWSEGAVLILAAAAVLADLLGRPPPGVNRTLLRFLWLYTLLVTVAYSLIPYKTPWCMLTFLHGMIILAGVGAWRLITLLEKPRPRIAAAVVLALLVLVPLAAEARRAIGRRYDADPRNPYVYAHTSRDFLKLVRRIEDVCAVSEQGRATLIQVVASPEDTWPLPFYLRAYSRVGYWTTPDELPASLGNPPILVLSLPYEDTLRDRLQTDYLREYYGLRPEVLVAVWIRRDLWDTFMKTRQ